FPRSVFMRSATLSPTAALTQPAGPVASPWSNALRNDELHRGSSQVEPDTHSACFFRMGLDLEAGLPAHGEHLDVLGQHHSLDKANLLRARIVQQVMQERPAQAMALQIASHEDCIFGALPARIA